MDTQKSLSFPVAMHSFIFTKNFFSRHLRRVRCPGNALSSRDRQDLRVTCPRHCGQVVNSFLLLFPVLLVFPKQMRGVEDDGVNYLLLHFGRRLHVLVLVDPFGADQVCASLIGNPEPRSSSGHVSPSNLGLFGPDGPAQANGIDVA